MWVPQDELNKKSHKDLYSLVPPMILSYQETFPRYLIQVLTKLICFFSQLSSSLIQAFFSDGRHKISACSQQAECFFADTGQEFGEALPRVMPVRRVADALWATSYTVLMPVWPFLYSMCLCEHLSIVQTQSTSHLCPLTRWCCFFMVTCGAARLMHNVNWNFIDCLPEMCFVCRPHFIRMAFFGVSFIS
jgi:hypothetical protein